MKYKFTYIILFLVCLLLVSAFSIQQAQLFSFEKHPLIQQLEDAFFSVEKTGERMRVLKHIRHAEDTNLIPLLEDFYRKMCLQAPPVEYQKGNHPLYERKEHAQVRAAILYLKMLKEGVIDFDEQTNYLLKSMVRKTEQSLDYVLSEHLLLVERREEDENLQTKLLAHLEKENVPLIKMIVLNLLEHQNKPNEMESLVLKRIDGQVDDLVVYNWMLESLRFNGGQASVDYFKKQLNTKNEAIKKQINSHLYSARHYKKNKEMYALIEKDSFLQNFFEEQDAIRMEQAKSLPNMEKDFIAFTKYYEEKKAQEKMAKTTTSELLKKSYRTNGGGGRLKREHWGTFLGGHSNSALISILQNSTDKIEKRKAAYILGSRTMTKDKQYTLTSKEQTQVNQIVQKYVKGTFFDNIKDATSRANEISEANNQLIRLWYLSLPTALKYLLSENPKERQWAYNMICELRNQEVAEAVFEVYRKAKTGERKEHLRGILTRGFQNTGNSVVPNRKPMSVEAYQAIHQQVILSALK